MQMLPSSQKVVKTPQKFIAWGLIAAVIWGGVKLFNYVAPTLIQFFQNIWLLIFFGTPIVLAALYIIFNPLVVWGFFTTLAWNVTKFFIKLDPLSVMDRYADYLSKKLKNLNETKVSLAGSRNELKREVERLKREITNNVKKGSAAQDLGDSKTASVCGTMITTDTQSLNSYVPILTRMERNLEFLNELEENWSTSITKLRYTINAKRIEHVNLKKAAKAVGLAAEFASGDTDAARLYNESVRQLEMQVSENIAKIEDFEQKSKGILSGLKVEKKMLEDEGLAEIEKYRKSGELLLPDFSAIGTIQQAEYVMVSPNKEQQNNKSKFFK